MKNLLFILLLLYCSFSPVFSQGEKPSEHPGEHPHIEIGAGGGISYNFEDQSFSPGTHLHFIFGITPVLGAGVGYEGVMGEHAHHSLLVMMSFKPGKHIDFNAGPGIIFPGNSEEAYRLQGNAELAYTFHITEHMHLGPIIDLGWSEHGIHTLVGIHVGFEIPEFHG